MLEMEKDLTPEIVAEIMEVSPRKVVELCADGKLGCYKVGKKYRITRQDLAKYRQANRVQPCEDSQPYTDTKPEGAERNTGMLNTMTEQERAASRRAAESARRIQQRISTLPHSRLN